MLQKLTNWLKSLRSPAASPAVKALVAGAAVRPALVGEKALELILEFEGLDQPWKRPPGESGITIGVGFDLGYCTRQEFFAAWDRHLSDPDLALLASVIGRKGSAAEAVERAMRRCAPITRDAAMEVFKRCTLPKWTRITAQTFPGLDVLNPDQQGVLVSLVFNRGGSLQGSRRTEMRHIANVLRQGNLHPDQKARIIAREILGMQRLWPQIPGLQRRRRFEAALMMAQA